MASGAGCWEWTPPKLATLDPDLPSLGSRGSCEKSWGSRWWKVAFWLQLLTPAPQASGVSVHGDDPEEGQKEACVQEYL